jgi:hypothetical protein
MRIILATLNFGGFGGSETYVLTVAEQFQRLCHDVTIYCSQGGPMAEFAGQRGLRVAVGTPGLPDTADVVLTQDAAMAYELAHRWPATPQAFHACSDVYEFQLPPQLPGVCRAVVVSSARMERHVRALAGEFEVLRLRHPIDTARFIPIGDIRAKPRRAVLLSNYLSGHRRKVLTEAWAGAGIECVQVGMGDPNREPETLIAEADIVVGKARAILEGMACGRAAYVLDVFGGDGWVTPDRYSVMEADNFAGLATEWVFSTERLKSDISEYRPEMGLVNRELILANHSAKDHARRLIECFRQLRPMPQSASFHTVPAAELARLIRAQASTELNSWDRAFQIQHLKEQISRLEIHAQDAATRASEAEAKLAAVEKQVASAHAVLQSRRVRAGLALGNAIDRVRCLWRR